MTNKYFNLENRLGEKLKPENLLCFGTENGRNLGLTVHNRSSISFKIPDSVDFDRILKDLRLFSAVLRVRKQSDVFYGWDSVYFSKANRIVAFDLLWYDKEYFLKRSNAYKSMLHERVFRDFGISSEEINVEHSSINYQ